MRTFRKFHRLDGTNGIIINQRRLMRDLNAIGRIGIGSRGAVTRLVFSVKELRSRQVLIHLMRQAGLAINIDGIGNIFGRLEGSDSKAPAVLAGSHLDTVIHGGKYDGPVGVIGALEAIRTISENKIAIRSPVEVVCFVGEESSRFGFSTLGSSLVAGEVHAKDLANAVDAQGTKLADVLLSLGIAPKKLHGLARDPKTLKAYLELHIEQGPILEAIGKRIGLVTSIAAPSRFRIIFTGQADHSGTTPMEMRKDALVAAAQLIAFIEKTCRKYSSMAQGPRGRHRRRHENRTRRDQRRAGERRTARRHSRASRPNRKIGSRAWSRRKRKASRASAPSASRFSRFAKKIRCHWTNGCWA